jgi:hypothetical protein
MHASIIEVAQKGDALALSDALEALIAEGKDTPTDREYALKAIASRPAENTAAYAFARAAITGRVVQSRGGIAAINLVGEVARWGMQSRKLDPSFREGAATRLLGTLCTQAPPSLLPSGCDSEIGIDMLEGLVKARPNNVENRLRLCEAYIFLSDVASALPPCCFALAHKSELRRDEQLLLERLVADANHPQCPPPEPAGAPGPKP